MRYLVLHPGALGDIILSLPALQLLRQERPAAEITLAANLDYSSVVARDVADHLVSFSTVPLHRLYADVPIPDEDARLWNSFDRIVSWTGSGSAEFVEKLSRMGPKVVVGRWKPARNEKRHVSQLFADSLDPWGESHRFLSPARIGGSSGDCLSGQRWLCERGWNPDSPLVALHPGAGSASKRWPIQKFAAVAEQIVSLLSARLLVIEGAAEPGLGRILARGLDRSKLHIAESLNLGLLAGVLLQCSAFVGNDSGVAHLAAGLGIPSVVLFGPTQPEQWVPLGNHVVSLRAASCCGPCQTGDGLNHTCLEALSPEIVMVAIREQVRVTSS